MSIKLLFYKTSSGKSPVASFIDSLNEPTQTKVLHVIDQLELYGSGLCFPLCKKVSKNLKELRISGKQNVRIIYTFQNGRYFLLHAFIKKSQKLPRKEVKTALARLAKLT